MDLPPAGEIVNFDEYSSDEEIDYPDNFVPEESATIRTKSSHRNLFKDEKFPTHQILGVSSRGAKFARPHDICDNPKMYVGGGARFDICQGQLGDCWFLSALATLTLNKDLLYKICPDQTFDVNRGYTGMFKFKFYQYGKWVEVTIDDRLPVDFSNRLIFTASKDKNEFWPALLEKAYAKLNGNYENLKGGHASEAMVDLTGGILELLEFRDRDFKMSDRELCSVMFEAIKNNALLSTAIQAKSQRDMEAERPDGLLKGHAYSVTAMRSPDKKFPFPMIRLRNPWGEVEWKGEGSDSDKRWGKAGADGDYDKSNDEDGEFYMPFHNYAQIFTKVEICRINVTHFKAEGQWHLRELDADWSRSANTAGGCANNWNTHLDNPFLIVETVGGETSDELIISLSQKHRRKQKFEGVGFLTIGFAIYKIDDDTNINTSRKLSEILPSGRRGEFSRNRIFNSTFCAKRDITERIKIKKAGKFAVVPSTFHPGERGSFHLRVLVEKPHDKPQINLDSLRRDQRNNVYNDPDANYVPEPMMRTSSQPPPGPPTGMPSGQINTKSMPHLPPGGIPIAGFGNMNIGASTSSNNFGQDPNLPSVPPVRTKRYYREPVRPSVKMFSIDTIKEKGLDKGLKSFLNSEMFQDLGPLNDIEPKSGKKNRFGFSFKSFLF